jgi:6-phosphogluconate dehydrogenase
MGCAIAYRLIKENHKVIAFDPNVKQVDIKKVHIVENISAIAKQVEIIWLMVPAGNIVDNVIEKLIPHVQKETVIIDGGNSNFKNTIKRYTLLKEKNIHLLDCGTSGGLHGKNNGFSLMIGGDKAIFEKTKPIFKAIATPNGFGYFGKSGAGHYVKMIHNGIEYSLLQAYAEGFHLLKENKNYKNLDLEKICNVWENGSIIRSWIIHLSKEIFSKHQEFKTISGDIGENLTGRWTLEESEKQGVDMPLLKKSLEIRAWSREHGGNYATKVVAMLRNAFGGHKVKKNSYS